MKIKMPLITKLFNMVSGQRKVAPIPTIESERHVMRDPIHSNISPGRVAFDAAEIQRHLVSMGYHPAEVLLVIGRMYGSIAGGFEGNLIDTADLEKKFFEMCRKERMVVSKMLSKINDNNPDLGDMH